MEGSSISALLVLLGFFAVGSLSAAETPSPTPNCDYYRQTCSRTRTCTFPLTCTTSRWRFSCSTRSICKYRQECSRVEVKRCCKGYRGSECNEPYCDPDCVNGDCIGPLRCQCQNGWRGTDCSEFYCDPQCINGSCSGPQTCTCNPGWIGALCDLDQNECLDPSPCDHECNNTVGSFQCSCFPGYQLASNGRNCNDIDECSTVAGLCEYDCLNTDGSYKCLCPPGHQLALDHRSCIDVDECSSDNGGCSQECNNTIGSYYCTCLNGFTLQADSHTCEDVDECHTTATNSRVCEQVCINTPGGYLCDCRHGFVLEGDSNCTDIDECAVLNGGCDHQCHNGPGFYNCMCDVGYKLQSDNHTCADVDECEQGLCSQGCENSIGSYFCYCNKGFFLSSDGTTCRESSAAALVNVVQTPNPQSQMLLNSVACMGSLCMCVEEKFNKLHQQGYLLNRKIKIRIGQSQLIAMFNPTKGLTAFDILSGFLVGNKSVILPVNTRVDFVTYNCDQDDFVLQTIPGGEMEIFPNLLTLSKVYITATIKTIVTTPEVAAVQIHGQWSINNEPYSLIVDTLQQDLWRISTKEYNLDIDLLRFLKDMNVHFEFPFPLPLKLELSNFTGLIQPLMQRAVLNLQGNLIIGDWYRSSGCVVVYLPLTSARRGIPTPQVAVTTNCDGTASSVNLTLLNVVQNVLGVNVLDIDFFGDLSLPDPRLVLKSPDFSLPKTFMLENIFHKARVIEEIHKAGDLSFIFDWPFSSAAERVITKFSKAVNAIEFSNLLDRFDVHSIASTIKEGIQRTLKTTVLNQLDVFRLPAVKFLLDVQNKTLDIVSLVDMQIPIVQDHIRILATEAHVLLNLSPASLTSSLRLLVRGGLQLGEREFKVSVLVDLVDNAFEVVTDNLDFDLGFLAKSFGFPFSLDAIKHVDLVSLLLRQASLKYLSRIPNKICSSGSAILFSRRAYASGCVTIASDLDVTLGVEVAGLSLPSLLGQIFGERIKRFVFFKQTSDIFVLYSSSYSAQSPLDTPLLSKVTNVEPGLTLGVETTWPESCGGDPLCIVMKFFMGDNVVMQQQLYIADDTFLRISASVGQINLGIVTLQSPAIVTEITPFSTATGITGSINILGITLTGGIKVRQLQADVVLEVSSRDCLDIIPLVTICNFRLGVALKPAPLVGIMFEGTVVIGVSSCKRLTVTAAFGVDPASPADNFIYAQQDSALTIQTLLGMLCINIPLPNFLGDTGFPDGYEVSYSPVQRSLPMLGITIPQGFRFKGTMSILGFRIQAEITIGESRIAVKARLPALRIAGDLLAMYESSSNRRYGPSLNVVVDNSNVNGMLSAYISVLGVSLDTQVTITDMGYFIQFNAKLLGLFDANIELRSNYGNILGANFDVSATLQTDFFQVIQRQVQKLAAAAQRRVDDAIRPLENALDGANKQVGRAIKAVQSAEEVVDGVRKGIDEEKDNINKIRVKIRRVCQIRRCRQIRFPCGLSCRRWRCRVKHCHFDEPICAGRNLFCYGLRAPFELLLGAAEAVLSALSAALRLAAGVLRAVQFALKSANIILDLAGNALQLGKQLLKEAINVFEAVVTFGLNNLLSINSVSVEAPLATASKARFAAAVDMTVLGNRVNWGGEIYLPNPANLISDIMKIIRKRVFSGKKKRSNIKVSKVLRLAEWSRQRGTPFPIDF